ncbi:MAG: UrcA family protein [Pseudomonadota bacterium]
MLKISAMAAFALALAAAAPASAQTDGEAVIVVPYADLNLSNEEGRAALDRRLARAAREVCGGKPDLRDIRARTAFRECLAATTKRYEAQRLAALEAANAKRVAVLADKLGLLAVY